MRNRTFEVSMFAQVFQHYQKYVEKQAKIGVWTKLLR